MIDQVYSSDFFSGGSLRRCCLCGSPPSHVTPDGLCPPCAYPDMTVPYDFRLWGSRVSSVARRGGVL